MRTPTGWLPTGTVTATVLLAVSITETLLEPLFVSVFSVRGDGDRKGALPHRDRDHHLFGGRVDHRDGVGGRVRDIQMSYKGQLEKFRFR
jgi:hypothetical protein